MVVDSILISCHPYHGFEPGHTCTEKVCCFLLVLDVVFIQNLEKNLELFS